jgi:prepilin signal peptidase PulO-like enzyme (type II secretory pathway)
VLVNGVGQLSAIALVSFMLLILNLLGLGMGDVKLLMIILLTLNSEVQSDLTLLAVLIIISSAMYIMQKTLRDRRLPRRIPLAPSIFMGLALYLATQ